MFVSSYLAPDKGAIVAFIAGALPTIIQIVDLAPLAFMALTAPSGGLGAAEKTYAALTCPAGRAAAYLLLATALLAAGGTM
jgi:hypothetical protein